MVVDCCIPRMCHGVQGAYLGLMKVHCHCSASSFRSTTAAPKPLQSLGWHCAPQPWWQLLATAEQLSWAGGDSVYPSALVLEQFAQPDPSTAPSMISNTQHSLDLCKSRILHSWLPQEHTLIYTSSKNEILCILNKNRKTSVSSHPAASVPWEQIITFKHHSEITEMSSHIHDDLPSFQLSFCQSKQSKWLINPSGFTKACWTLKGQRCLSQ